MNAAMSADEDSIKEMVAESAGFRALTDRLTD
jgi:hypothetical protein